LGIGPTATGLHLFFPAAGGVHPLLEKEAHEMVARSGAVPRKMEFPRG
jgi:hypothetical protein